MEKNLAFALFGCILLLAVSCSSDANTECEFIRHSGISSLNDVFVASSRVTFDEYNRYCSFGCRYVGSENRKHNDKAVSYISWYDAIIYCNLRSLSEGFKPVYYINVEYNPRKWTGVNVINGKLCGPNYKNALWDSVQMDLSSDGYRLPTREELDVAGSGGVFFFNIENMPKNYRECYSNFIKSNPGKSVHYRTNSESLVLCRTAF